MKKIALQAFILLTFMLASCLLAKENSVIMKTKYAAFKVNKKGFITSITARATKKEYSPDGHPSPVMSLHKDGKLIAPIAATFNKKTKILQLTYPNKVIAKVKLKVKKQYIRFELLSLSPRQGVDAIVWGPLNSTVKSQIGDVMGVVHNTEWTIGILGLDDNTLPGPVIDGDCYGMHYFIHSPDPKKYPIPSKYKEGQIFNIGGNGVHDTAFYSHPEEYFQFALGNAIKVNKDYTSIYYNARDRRKPRNVLYSLLPHFPSHKPKNMTVDPVDVDFIGSAVAIYACPSKRALKTIESIVLSENLPHPTLDGKWIKDPASFRPDIAWYGAHDKMIEYANALGLKAVQDEGLGEYYPNPANLFSGKTVGFANGKRESIKKFTDKTNKHGIKYGLHTLCGFIQGGSDVTPVPNEHLQTVCRTKLAKAISATDTTIVVTEPSFLGECGTWPENNPSHSVLRIGKEILTYNGITKKAPYTLQNVKRGQHGVKPCAHAAGDEVVKLQRNCYNGFVPDIKLLLDYADHYAKLCHEGGMEYIDFDGNETMAYTNHGSYAFAIFYRRLFDTYAKLSGGKELKVMGSAVVGGCWHYMAVLNVGGGNRMFNPISGRFGIQGKDWRNALARNLMPTSFGIQGFNNNWSIYDIQNLQAKAIGWDATYMLGLSDKVEKCAKKDELFKAFRLWQDARDANVFSEKDKAKFRNPDYQFHLKKVGSSYVYFPVKGGKRGKGIKAGSVK